MKRYHYLLILCAVGLFACKKGNIDMGNGCISQIRRHYNIGPDSLVAANLLKQNNIRYSNLAFDRSIFNDTVRDVDKSIIFIHQAVFAVQYFNGLPVLTNEPVYNFKNGVLWYTTGTSYSAVNLNATHTQSLNQLRKSFLAAAGTGNTLKDSCLVAEFGYYDLNSNTTNKTPLFVKAWLVMPQDGPYPQALIRDDNAGVISYYSGIIQF